MRRVLLVAFLAASFSAACHTITEELPNRPTPINDAPIPVIQIPVPQTTPVPSPVAVAPTPRPKPSPTPPPADDDPPDAGEQNRNPVARMACSVYYVECNGQVLPNSHGASSAAVGCRVRLDTSTKDADGAHTFRTAPRWVFSNPGMIDVSVGNAWNPAFTGKGRHRQTMYAEADGVRCGSFGIDIR